MTVSYDNKARVAQLAERHLGKVEVSSSNLDAGSSLGAGVAASGAGLLDRAHGRVLHPYVRFFLWEE